VGGLWAIFWVNRYVLVRTNISVKIFILASKLILVKIFILASKLYETQFSADCGSKGGRGTLLKQICDA